MKLYFLCLSALTVGALCKIDDVCIVQSGKKGVEGKCQKKSECMKAGLAAFSKSGRTDISGTVEELACPGEDEEVQCCVEIKCGSYTCRNNVESNPCAEGTYVANFRDRTLCPSSSSEDNIQCCVENSHSGLKRRQSWNYDQYGPDSTRGSYLDLGGIQMASADGMFSTMNNDDAPSVGEGIAPIVPITPFGGSVPTTPDVNIASTSAGTTVPAFANTAVDTPGAPPAVVGTGASIIPATPNTDVATSNITPNTNFNLAQLDNYSQSARGTSPVAPTPNAGVSFGLSNSLRPEVSYTNNGGSKFSLGPTTPVTNMLSNPGSSLNGIQGDFSIGLRKLRRSLADAFN